ncbi:uncharacterized protein LOC110980819 [Acanthaster planci]|uniref:Uncharacterized protein LOC110980819 n=1 Tax=Acanthaster planci TaxID=133434 RepID=A0A8B7YQ13_ACAPL|nr:uncharacterized protein LOC110980819 [Acanthaster planci]
MSLRQKSVKNVRSPRSASGAAFVLQHLPQTVTELLAAKRAAKKPTEVTVVDGRPQEWKELSEWLWDGSQVQAKEALNTEFIQGIKSGLLDPTDYGGYTVQDAVYCYNATTYYLTAAGKTSDLAMSKFIQGRIDSYKSYTQTMFDEWHIRDPTGVSMGTAAASYSAYEKHVAETNDPIYLLIAMLPCDQLWGWLAEQIKSGISDKNVYSFWIEDNLPQHKSKLAEFIDANAHYYEVFWPEAKVIYQRAMQGEVDFFTSATPPPKNA